MNRKLVFGALTVALVLSATAFAAANIVSYPGVGNPNSVATGPVAVKATVNPKITLTINTPDAGQSVDFGLVDPGATIASKTVTLTVDSNKTFNLTKAISGDDLELGLTTSVLPAGGPKGQGTNFNDVYTIAVPWDTAPNPYTANVQYTVTQY